MNVIKHVKSKSCKPKRYSLAAIGIKAMSNNLNKYRVFLFGENGFYQSVFNEFVKRQEFKS